MNNFGIIISLTLQSWNHDKEVGEIYLKMLEKGTPPTYDQKHIRSIIEFLYNDGSTGSAGEICNIYGSRGQKFLMNIYEKHSNRT